MFLLSLRIRAMLGTLERFEWPLVISLEKMAKSLFQTSYGKRTKHTTVLTDIFGRGMH